MHLTSPIMHNRALIRRYCESEMGYAGRIARGVANLMDPVRTPEEAMLLRNFLELLGTLHSIVCRLDIGVGEQGWLSDHDKKPLGKRLVLLMEHIPVHRCFL